jgi:sigma-B regulation protein RsbU (phosphoserine phosphatase)
MAVTRTLLKNLAQSGLSPSQTLERTNDILSEENDESMFVTLFFALYDTRTGHLRYANAGHNPPFVVSRQGSVTSPKNPTGVILGVFKGQKYGEDEIKLDLEDTLVLYTDGVTEAHAPSHELYGEKRFKTLLSERASDGPEQLSKTVVETVSSFQHGNQFDDITLLVLQRHS